MQPLFINGQSGALFALYYPSSTGDHSKAIVHVPAFAEEMNKSRRMVALQAQALADQGYAVLVLDLFGTGDSAGDFGDATWSGWLDDIADAIGWLTEQGTQSICLWGLRIGGLLALDFVSQRPEPIEQLIAWQPVLNGDTFVTQFLRLRIAAAMLNSNAPQEKTADLKQQLLDGQCLEVAGYSLNPQLVAPLLSLRADKLALPVSTKITLFEVMSNPEANHSMPLSQFHVLLQNNGVTCSINKAVGDNFWASQEISCAPQLIALTSQILA